MYYFASDIHLKRGFNGDDREVERQFVLWLTRAAEDAEIIFLCGDIFDFWFEYKRSVPMGMTRTLGALSSLTDRGVRIIFMAGNHDMWLGDYLSSECGVEIYREPTTFQLGAKKVHVAHGDNLNIKGDFKLRAMNAILRSKCAYRLTRRFIHPDLILKFGQWWSSASRKGHDRVGYTAETNPGLGALIEYAEQHQQQERCDIYIFGHLHLHTEHLGDGFKAIFTNDWSSDPHFAKIDNNGEISLEKI